LLLLPLDCYNSSTGFKLRPALATLGGILGDNALYLVRRCFYLPDVNYLPKELFEGWHKLVLYMLYVYSALLYLSLTFEISLLLKSSTVVVASFVLNIHIPWRSQREVERTENGRGQDFFCPSWLTVSSGGGGSCKRFIVYCPFYCRSCPAVV
jgi:hypothetical protein